MKRKKTNRLSKADEKMLKLLETASKQYDVYLKINSVASCHDSEPQELPRAWNYPLTLTLVGTK